MPRIHDPQQPHPAVGSKAAPSNAQRRRHRQHKTNKASSPTNGAAASAHKNDSTEGFIGRPDLFQFAHKDAHKDAALTTVALPPKTTTRIDPKARQRAVPRPLPTRTRAARKATMPTKNTTSPESLESSVPSPASSSSSIPPTRAPSNEEARDTYLPGTTTRHLCVPPSWRVRHALLVDTRTIDTGEGLAACHQVLQHAHALLRTLAQRGVAPTFLGSTVSGDPTPAPPPPQQQQPQTKPLVASSLRKTHVPLQVQVEHVDAELALFLETLSVDVMTIVPVRPPLNVNNKRNTAAVRIPKRLLAHDSWKIFADLVDKVVQTDKDLRNNNNNNNNNNSSSSRMLDDGSTTSHTKACAPPPIHVTILTHDVALFCDAKSHSHKLAVNHFWERVRPAFQDAVLGSIDVIVVQTGSIEFFRPAEHDPLNEQIVQDDSVMDDATSAASHSKDENKEQPTLKKHSAKVVACIQCIVDQISNRAASDYKTMRGYRDRTNPISLSIRSIDCHAVGFQSLARQWMRNAMRLPSGRVGKLTFDLPETVDGMQCSISLDVSYKIMPYRADSVAAAGMLVDLQLLVGSNFDVLQLIPISCVDASLLFGVPMEVRPGLESDINQFKEMKALVSHMMRYLCDKECGLLLRSSDDGDGDTSRSRDALHHIDGQIFLLMPHELPSADLAAGASKSCAMSQSDNSRELFEKAVPSSGVLFRYACAEQLLDAASNEAYAFDYASDDAETIKQLAECVENSLDSVESSSINPLLVDLKIGSETVERAPSQASNLESSTDDHVSLTSVEPDDDIWAKETGVGATMSKDNAPEENRSESEDDLSDGMFSYDD